MSKCWTNPLPPEKVLGCIAGFSFLLSISCSLGLPIPIPGKLGHAVATLALLSGIAVAWIVLKITAIARIPQTLILLAIVPVLILRLAPEFCAFPILLTLSLATIWISHRALGMNFPWMRFTTAAGLFLVCASALREIPEIRQAILEIASSVSSARGPDELGLRWMIFALAVLFGFVAARKRYDVLFPYRRGLAILGFVACTSLATFLFLAPANRTRAAGGEIYFLLGSEASIESPLQNRYGPETQNKPEFGALAEYFSKSGIKAEALTSPIQEASLQVPGIIIAANFDRHLDENEIQAIDRFLENGGSLIVLCDHTDVGGQLAPTNALLAKSGIQLRYDSAIPFDRAWRWDGRLEVTRHELGLGIDPSNGLLWSIGASLEIKSPALPLILGRGAFSDPGNSLNEKGAFLGSMQWEPGEYQGELALAAVQTVGKGRLLVFGDTSSFQDSSIPANYPWITRLMNQLLSPPEGQRNWEAVFLLAAMSILIASAFTPQSEFTLSLALGLLVGIEGSRAWKTHHASSELPIRPPAYSVVVIDTQHPGRFSLRSGKGDSPYGFYRAARRKNLVPLFANGNLQKLLHHQPAALVLWSPETPYEIDEIASIDNYLRKGGSVWIFGSPKQEATMASMWNHFGVEFENEALGNCDETVCLLTNTPIRPVEAWPLTLRDGLPVATCWEETIAATKSVGKGRLTVFSDHRGFLGGNLENLDRADTWNIHYLEACFERLAR